MCTPKLESNAFKPFFTVFFISIYNIYGTLQVFVVFFCTTLSMVKFLLIILKLFTFCLCGGQGDCDGGGGDGCVGCGDGGDDGLDGGGGGWVGGCGACGGWDGGGGGGDGGCCGWDGCAGGGVDGDGGGDSGCGCSDGGGCDLDGGVGGGDNGVCGDGYGAGAVPAQSEKGGGAGGEEENQGRHGLHGGTAGWLLEVGAQERYTHFWTVSHLFLRSGGSQG